LAIAYAGYAHSTEQISLSGTDRWTDAGCFIDPASLLLLPLLRVSYYASSVNNAQAEYQRFFTDWASHKPRVYSEGKKLSSTIIIGAKLHSYPTLFLNGHLPGKVRSTSFPFLLSFLLPHVSDENLWGQLAHFIGWTSFLYKHCVCLTS